MLYLIGLGLGDAKDITVKGLETLKKCKKVYLESYTSLLTVGKEVLVGFILTYLKVVATKYGHCRCNTRPHHSKNEWLNYD